MTFLERPNLPTAKVTAVAISSDENEIKSSLNNLGIHTIEIDVKPSLDSPVSKHTDMIINHLGNNKIVICNYSEKLNKALIDLGFNLIFSNSSPQKNYPNDVVINSAIIGSYCITRQLSTDKAIIEHCLKNGIKILNVNQGYSKCSVCIVNENSIITADKSICNAAEKNGFDVLLIEPGCIELKGYEYGFIGGCGGLIDESLLAFTGDIKRHKNYMQIKDFLSKKHVEYVCLTNGILKDIGGIIPLINQ